MTHTLARLQVSKPTFDEIAKKLRAAGYNHAFLSDGNISLDGLALESEQVEQKVPPRVRWEEEP